MLLAEQIGSWSPPPSGPCWKWRLHMARLRRVGLVGPLARDNAEWSSALLGHAGIENRICRIIHLRARGVSRRGGIDPKGLEARGPGQQHFVLSSFFSSFHPIQVSVLREGVCLETRGGDTPPAPHSKANLGEIWTRFAHTLQGRGSGDAAPLREVCNHSVPLYGRRHRGHRQIER